MGRFPTAGRAPALAAHRSAQAAWREHRARGLPRDARSPSASPGKALGVPKSRSGQGRGSRGLCFPRVQLQLGGGRRAGGAERGCFGTNHLRFCKAGSGGVSRPQGRPGPGLSPLHVARGRWRCRTWFERLRGCEGAERAGCARRLDGFATRVACQRAALLSRVLPSCSWLFLALCIISTPPPPKT